MDNNLFDFHKIFFGDAPTLFLLEIILRTVIMYSYTIILLRFLGKRGMGQLSTLEVAIIICFGSAVGDPMIGTPILHGMVAITTVAFLQVGMERFINRHKKLEEFMEGTPDCLVREGIIDLEQLKQNNLSQEDLFRSLRTSEVQHLGQIKHALFETSGTVSVIFQPPKSVKAGLSVMPAVDRNQEDAFTAGTLVQRGGNYCCLCCGWTRRYNKNRSFVTCRYCSSKEWTKAYDKNY
jgi:uncharacterized membrane protein YcaP (DUF421 family)